MCTCMQEVLHKRWGITYVGWRITIAVIYTICIVVSTTINNASQYLYLVPLVFERMIELLFRPAVPVIEGWSRKRV